MTDIQDNIPSKASTKERILDAAEELFSEKGFAETSMRDITSAANVNLASVNYHFGSKDELINAVFIRTAEPLINALQDNLNDLKKNASDTVGSLEKSLKALVRSGLDHSRSMKGGGGIFMRLLSRAYSDPEAKVRNYLVKHYSGALSGYVELLMKVVPNVSPDEIYWRSYYVLGSLMFVMSSEKTLRNIAERDYQFKTDDEMMVDYLVKFLAAGFRG